MQVERRGVDGRKKKERARRSGEGATRNFTRHPSTTAWAAKTKRRLRMNDSLQELARGTSPAAMGDRNTCAL